MDAICGFSLCATNSPHPWSLLLQLRLMGVPTMSQCHRLPIPAHMPHRLDLLTALSQEGTLVFPFPEISPLQIFIAHTTREPKGLDSLVLTPLLHLHEFGLSTDHVLCIAVLCIISVGRMPGQSLGQKVGLQPKTHSAYVPNLSFFPELLKFWGKWQLIHNSSEHYKPGRFVFCICILNQAVMKFSMEEGGKIHRNKETCFAYPL